MVIKQLHLLYALEQRDIRAADSKKVHAAEAVIPRTA